MIEIPLKHGREAHVIHLAPLGLYSRYMLTAYLRHVLTVAAALMTIALTIDLWPQIPLLTAAGAQSTLGTIWTIARLAVLRIPDLLPPFIPFATFLGVVWSEGAFTGSRERMLIWNSGRSPLQCVAPAIMIGVLMGAALFALDGYLRPAAIAVQIHEKLGREGIRLDRTRSSGNHWFALPNGLLRAEIVYGPPLSLRDVTIYTLDAVGHLSEVDTAALASPLGSEDQWLLRNGHYWNVKSWNVGVGTGRREIHHRQHQRRSRDSIRTPQSVPRSQHFVARQSGDVAPISFDIRLADTGESQNQLP